MCLGGLVSAALLCGRPAGAGDQRSHEEDSDHRAEEEADHEAGHEGKETRQPIPV
jgi:hypothetical protein